MIECENCILEKAVHYCEVDCLAFEDALREHDEQIIAEFIDKFIKRTYLIKMTKAECIKAMYDIADELKEQK